MKNYFIYILFLIPTISQASPLVLNEMELQNIDYTKKAVLTKAMRSGPSRRDEYVGVGICSKTTKYDTSVGSNIKSPVEANLINDAITPISFSDGRIFQPLMSKNNLFGVLDFKSKKFESMSHGDFQQDEDYFDFSADPYDSYRMTMRLRGYLNVLNPTIKTFGLNTSTGGLLLIGGQPILYSDSKSPSKLLNPQEVTREVSFESEGMYAVEIIYYENQATFDFLEIGQLYGVPTNSGFKFGYSNTALNVLENNKDILSDGSPNKMKEVNNYVLYNTIDGIQSYQCSLCSNDTECTKGQKCLDGICQNTATACNTNIRCGDSCSACTSSTDLCSKGQCVQCVSDFNCTFEQVCDSGTNKCVPKPPECVSDAECKYPWTTTEYVCNTSVGKCELKKPECSLQSDCKTGEVCNLDHKCQVYDPRIPCDKDDACSLYDRCDLTQHYCVRLPQNSCRADIQCSTNYKCDTTNYVCIKTTSSNPSNPSDGNSGSNNGTGTIGNNGKPAPNCNHSGQIPSILSVLFNLISFGFAFKKSYHRS